MSNRYTFTDETVASYLEKHQQYSEYCALLNQVKISNKSESTVFQLLSARGNFTCFAPNNEAIQLYLDSLQRKNLIAEATWESFENEEMRDSIRKVIVYNSIIDGGDLRYFKTSDLPEDGEEINTPNMNDRLLTVGIGKVNPDSIFINKCNISLSNRDIEAINGCVHEVEDVIAPSNSSIGDMLKLGKDLEFLAELVTITGWSDTLNVIRDDVYEAMSENGDFDTPLESHPTFHQEGTIPAHRKYGFTIFAETNDVFANKLGLDTKNLPKNSDEWKVWVLKLKQHLVENKYFADAVDNEDYRDKNNIINQFVSYHILPIRIPYQQLVIHYNEKGYNYANATAELTVPAFEYYETMGKPNSARKLLKIYESNNISGTIYLNRFPNLDPKEYQESPVPAEGTHEAGIRITSTGEEMSSEENNAINGLIYKIDDLLVYSNAVRESMQKERMRYDIAALLPEMMNNNLRRPMADYVEGAAKTRGFPTSYQYFSNMEINEGARCYYLTGLGQGWNNYQGDEFNITGQYEITLRLPPVPRDGVYEIRYAISANDRRGMCQVYWGEDKNDLPAMDIPLDLRMGGTVRYVTGNPPSIAGWESDGTDETVNDDIDKRMRNNGFMKGADYYSASPGSQSSVRTNANIIRRILVREPMEADKTYYIKFKSVIEVENAEFYFDYIEFCAKEVYDNPSKSEDIW